MIKNKKILDKYNIKPFGYTKKNNVVIVDTKDEKYVLKKRNKDKKELFNYLRTRNFNYFPNIYNEEYEDEYDIYKYYHNLDIPSYEKANDIINIISLLHTKTTHYRNVDIDDYKKIYEELNKKLEYLINYYADYFDLIDSEIYMSPSNYLLARNITKINSLLSFCNNELDNWYNLVKDKEKERVSIIHNNLELDHLIRNDNTYLISWDKAKEDLPIYDIYNLYKNNYNEIDIGEILSEYENRYPLEEDERKLLFILISIPDKIEFDNDEFENTKKVNELLFYIYKTDKTISKYYSNEEYKKY